MSNKLQYVSAVDLFLKFGGNFQDIEQLIVKFADLRRAIFARYETLSIGGEAYFRDSRRIQFAIRGEYVMPHVH